MAAADPTPSPALPGDAVLPGPVHLAGALWQVAGARLTHPYDAAAYLLLDEHAPVLIDCGSGHGHERLVAHLAALGVTPADLGGVLATHGHFDHLAGLARLRSEAPGLALALHPAERRAVETGDGLRTCASLLYDEPFPALAVDADLLDATTLVRGQTPVDVLHTPGHSPGSCSLVVHTGERRVLIAGDALWGGFHPAVGSDLTAWQASLERLCRTGVDALTFGHGVHHLVEDAPAHLREAASRLGWFFDPWFRRPAAGTAA